jgi:hypothetical protein
LVINNFLEFLDMVVNVWLMCIKHVDESECLLAVGDNTSATGWMFRSSQLPKDSVDYDAVQLAARHVATLVIDSEHCLATQHTKGEENIATDLLPCRGDVRGSKHLLAFDDPTDKELSQCCRSHLPQVIPPAFKISPLPNAVLSWITLALRTVKSSWI